MATTPVYLLDFLEPSNIEISQDELRSLIELVEAELQKSKIYCRAVATVQKLLESSAEQAQALFKAVTREAISIAFQQLTQQHLQPENNTPPEENKTEPPADEPTDFVDLTECLTSVKLHNKSAITTTIQVDVPSNPQVIANTTNQSSKNLEQNPKKRTSIISLKRNHKPSKAELAKQMAAEKRKESLREVGTKLRRTRESQGLSLSQLGVYTHVSMHYMEAVENGRWESLPDDVFVRGFIRVMGNALGLNGTHLAASIPAPEPVKAVLPTWYQPQRSVGAGMALSPVHVYLGYAALVAGAVGGLSMISQQGNANRVFQSDTDIPSSSSQTKFVEDKQVAPKPGIESTSAGIKVGRDISPPEAL
jgi:cytoskeleton protein RodZ